MLYKNLEFRTDTLNAPEAGIFNWVRLALDLFSVHLPGQLELRDFKIYWFL